MSGEVLGRARRSDPGGNSSICDQTGPRASGSGWTRRPSRSARTRQRLRQRPRVAATRPARRGRQAREPACGRGGPRRRRTTTGGRRRPREQQARAGAQGESSLTQAAARLGRRQPRTTLPPRPPSWRTGAGLQPAPSLLPDERGAREGEATSAEISRGKGLTVGGSTRQPGWARSTAAGGWRPSPGRNGQRGLSCCGPACASALARTRVVRGWQLRTGDSKSCGCLSAEASGARAWRHGWAGTPEYFAWAQAKQRCRNPACPGYHDYGQRGIRICNGLADDFACFIAVVGPRPGRRHSLDRINNATGSYTCGRCPDCRRRGDPLNVRWATRRQQNLNRRNTCVVEYRGESRVLADLAVENGQVPSGYSSASTTSGGGPSGGPLAEPCERAPCG